MSGLYIATNSYDGIVTEFGDAVVPGSEGVTRVPQSALKKKLNDVERSIVPTVVTINTYLRDAETLTIIARHEYGPVIIERYFDPASGADLVYLFNGINEEPLLWKRPPHVVSENAERNMPVASVISLVPRTR